MYPFEDLMKSMDVTSRFINCKLFYTFEIIAEVSFTIIFLNSKLDIEEPV